MEGLLSMLLFAGLFFVMMRYGCGAHIMHGHDRKDKSQHKHIDPVCGMEVDVEQGYGKMLGGNLFRFCSRDCLDKFEADPEQYLKNQNHDKRHHEGGAL